METQTDISPADALERGMGAWGPHPHPFAFNAQAWAWRVGRTVYAVVAHIPACDYYFLRVGNEQSTLRAQDGETPKRFSDRLRAWCETRIEMGAAVPLSMPIARPLSEQVSESPLLQMVKKAPAQRQKQKPAPAPKEVAASGKGHEMRAEVAITEPS